MIWIVDVQRRLAFWSRSGPAHWRAVPGIFVQRYENVTPTDLTLPGFCAPFLSFNGKHSKDDGKENREETDETTACGRTGQAV
jgi:hypothetical protein